MFVKIFSSILASSVWAESKDTRLAWVALLAMADREGFIFGSEEGIARIANLPLPDFTAALEVLAAPDPKRPGQEYEGRRIERIPEGVVVLNYPKYRDMKDADLRREQVRTAVQRHRAKKAPPVITGNHRKASVNSVSPSYSDAVSDAEAEAINGSGRNGTGLFERAWKSYPRRAGGNSTADARKAWDARLKEGVTGKAMLDGTVRYADYIRATDREGTEYVKQGKTFYGPGEHWTEKWDTPRKKTPGQDFLDLVGDS
jgi:hypothetical protein